MDLYEIMGVSKDANLWDIRKAYYDLALKYHPDKQLHQKEWAHEKFTEINNAYDVLKDTKKREEYDELLKMGPWDNVAQTSSSPENAFTNFSEKTAPRRERTPRSKTNFRSSSRSFTLATHTLDDNEWTRSKRSRSWSFYLQNNCGIYLSEKV